VAGSQLTLARTAFRLRIALLRGSLRSGPGSGRRRFGFAVGAVIGTLGAAIMVLALLAGRRDGNGDDVAVVLFTVLLFGWIVLPVLTFGSDDLLDPARLALLPLTGRQFLIVMGVGASIGIGPVLTLVAACGLIPATADGPASAAVAVVAVVLFLMLCLAASRATTAALSRLLRSRRGRDLGVAFAALIGLSFQLVNPLIQVVSRDTPGSRKTAHSVAAVLRWTPSGLLAAAPGRPLPAALGSLLIVAAIIGVLLFCWERSIRRTLERPDETGGRRRRQAGLAPRGVPVPAGRAGAIMAKDLRYLIREPRRTVTLLTSSLLPVLACLGPWLASGGSLSPAVVFAVCGVALFSGLSGSNRFGMDGTATWMLISSTTDPGDARRDLIGDDLASALFAVPVLLVSTLVLATFTGGWALAPLALGCALALYGVSLGTAALMSVHAAYAVPQTQNAFVGNGTGQGCAAGLIGLAAMLATVATCLPLLALLIPALVTSAATWKIALLIAGPVYGIAVGMWLRRLAARDWERRAPEVLAVLVTERS
jgi:ABC-2 type transport system permease protein